MHNLVVGTLNWTGIIYKSHFGVWLLNRLQYLLETTQHLILESHWLMGWINGDLHVPAGEKIGILPVPDSICATADIESYHSEDSQYRHAYLAREQGTKYAVIAVHTAEEKALFKKLIQENLAFNSMNAGPDWKQSATVWNWEANGKNIFYKVCNVCYFQDCDYD